MKVVSIELFTEEKHLVIIETIRTFWFGIEVTTKIREERLPLRWVSNALLGKRQLIITRNVKVKRKLFPRGKKDV